MTTALDAAGTPAGLAPPDLSWARRVHRRREPVPTVLQLEATECGAACLAMILARNGKWVSLEDLRIACGVSRDGASARSVVLAARAYGMTADGFRRELEDLAAESLPLIAYWRFSHFVVIEGVSRHGLRVNDPAVGRSRVTWEEADRDFTGIVLRLAPGPRFEPGGRPPSAAEGLRRRLAGSGTALAFLLLCGLALAVPVALGPMALQGYVDRVVLEGLSQWIVPTLATLALAAVLVLWLTWWQGRVAARLSLSLSQRQAVQLMGHALRLPMTFYAQRYTGDVAQRVQLVDAVSDVAASQLVPAALGLVTAATVGVLLLTYSWPLAVVALATGAVVMLVVRASGSWRAAAAGRIAREDAALAGALAYGLRSIETVRSSGTEADLFIALTGRQARLSNAATGLTAPATVLDTLPTLASGVATAIVLSVGGLLVVDDQLTPGGLVAVLALLPLFLAPLARWAALATTLRQARAALARLDDLLDQPADPLLSPGTTPSGSAATRPRGELELRDVTFGYSGTGEPLLSGVSLRVSPGRRVGLVGASGSGKSTIARLAVGLYQPWEGAVLLDGTPLPEVSSSLRCSTIGYVDQEIVLFSGSVRDNITLFDATVPDEDVVAAARAAAIAAEVEARPGGYEARVADGGHNFSGGQQQRLEIARALAARPRVLVLDEATSALDPVVEQQVMDAVAATGAGLLLVAHRLSTVRDCDEIVVLEHGRVVERGTHDQLLDRRGAYARLVAP